MFRMALDGVRVIDLSRFIAGPYCTSILADMGAEVITIEPPGGAELRHVVKGDEINLKWEVYHRNTKSVTLNLRTDDGKEILRKLVGTSDVVVENFRPGTIKRMGFDYPALKELNERIILTSISGFGQTGPLSARPCFDAIAQAMSGLMSLNGDPEGDPTVLGPGFFADLATGQAAALGTLLALFYRERTGIGQHVDVSMLESVLPFLMTTLPEYLETGVPPVRMGNRDRDGVPANAFHTKDGMVYLDAGGERLFRDMFTAMDMPGVIEDPRFKLYSDRLKNRVELEQIITDWMRDKTTTEVLTTLEQVIPIGPVRTIPEVAACDQVKARGYLVELDDPKLRGVPLPGVPIHLSESPGSVRWASPEAGEHNVSIYQDLLGYGADDLANWAEQSVI